MSFKCVVVVALITLAAVYAAPYYHGHDSGHHEGHGGHEGGSSHQSVHLVSHGGDDHHGHGHDDGHGHGHDDGHDDGHDSPAEYTFDYGVTDKKTGDIKGHSETRKGHEVSGHYELIDSDGHKRTVTYTADKHKGFQATVHREPTHIKVPESSKGHVVHVGGHAEVEQSADHEESHGHDGHGGHHYGHGGKSNSYSIKQEHGAATHGHGHGHEHGHDHSYGHH